MGKIITFLRLKRELPLKVLFVKARSKWFRNKPLKKIAGRTAEDSSGSSCFFCREDGSNCFGISSDDSAGNNASLGEVCKPALKIPGEVIRELAESNGGKNAAKIFEAAKQSSVHVFDLLGSGPVKVGYDTAAFGLEGVAYDMSPGIAGAEKIKEKMANLGFEAGLFEGVNGETLKEGLIKYEPIDWHLDFKSGHRWQEDSAANKIEIAAMPGADIKVPWELSRFHHGLWLGLAHRLENGDSPLGKVNSEESGAKLTSLVGETKNLRLGTEFVLQILDWISANPVGYGVNWICAMEVAIRAVNWLWAWAFLQGHPAVNNAFSRLLVRSLYEHGLYIEDNLEYVGRGYNSNHYLANLTGLIYLGSALPYLKNSDRWLSFGLQELATEMKYQVYEDGVSYESSTSYHRLVTEMFLACTIQAQGLNPGRGTEKSINPLPPWFYVKLWRMIDFTAVLIKEDGTMPRFGDDDSGRLLPFIPGDPGAQSHLLAAGGAFFNNPDWQEKSGVFKSEGSLLAAGKKCEAVLSANQEIVATSTPKNNNKIKSVSEKGHQPEQSFIVAGGNKMIKNFYRRARLRSGFTVKIEKGAKGGTGGFTEFACFPHGGFYVHKNRNYYFSISCAPNGMGGIGAHAHNDKLSFELSVAGRDFFVDGGSYLYSPFPEIRNEFRSTLAHNTVALADKEQNPFINGYLFALPERSKAKIILADKDKFAGCHRGFGFFHYRAFKFSPNKLEVFDLLEKAGPAYIILNLHPRVEITPKDDKTLSLSHDGIIIKMQFNDLREMKIKEGYYAPIYGRREANKRLVIPIK